MGGLEENNKTKISLIGRCKKGYKGNLCQACDFGYSSSGVNTCSKCPSKSEIILKLIGIGIVVLIILIIVVWTSIKSAYEPTHTISVYIKIFANYI